MSKVDDLSQVLARCRYLRNRRDLERTLPGVSAAVPPLTPLSLTSDAVGDVSYGYPVVPGPELIELLTLFLGTAVSDVRDDNPRGETRIHGEMELFQEEPYFAELVNLVAETRAHGTVFGLDGVLWIHLADLINRLLYPNEEFLNWVREVCPGARDEALGALARLGTDAHDPASMELRREALKRLIARNEFANRTVSRMVGDAQPNALHQAMVGSRLLYLLPPWFLSSFHPRSLVTARDFKLRATQVGDLLLTLRSLVEDLYRHRDDRALAGAEQYFVSQYLDEQIVQHVSSLPVRLFSGHETVNEDDTLPFKLGWNLALDESAQRFLIGQIEQLNVRRALSGQLNQVSSRFRRDLASPERLRGQLEQVTELARQVRALDFLDALRSFLTPVEERRGEYFLRGEKLRSSAVPLDLGSYYETFRRNRSGTAVFIDLIGFTNRSRELFFGHSRGTAAGEMEQSERGELAALALERLFMVRQRVREFGGRPEGFEGDAILDIFPEPLSALRYVTYFRTNFLDNEEVQFRPFSKPVKNPFTGEGFRVGIATGDYTLVNIPDVDVNGELRARLRTIGPTLNKASRLNTGKRGAVKQYLTRTRDDLLVERFDPLGLFQVQVLDEDLNNTGICIDLPTFEELRTLVRRERLPYWMPNDRREFTVRGEPGVPQAYNFDLIFTDPLSSAVLAIKRLRQVPRLKGLNRADSVVLEVLVFGEEEYLAFLHQDAQQEDRSEAPEALGEVGRGFAAAQSSSPGRDHLSDELPDYFLGRVGEPGEDLSAQAAPVSAQPAEPPAPADEPAITSDSLDELFAGDDGVSLDASGDDGDTSADLAAMLAGDSWDDSLAGEPFSEDDSEDVPRPVVITPPPPQPPSEASEDASVDEEIDDVQLDAFMQDVLADLETEASEGGYDEDSAAFGEEDLDAFAADVFGSDEWQSLETDPEQDVVEAAAGPPLQPLPETPTEPEVGESTTPSTPPAPGEAAEETAAVHSLLGELDDGFAQRLTALLGNAGPVQVAPDEPSVTVTSIQSSRGPRVTRRQMEQLLTGYHMVVRMLEGRIEVWFGRLSQGSLFDHHRYVLPVSSGQGLDVDQALRLFLEDKQREEWIAFGTRFAALPEDGSDPVPVPLDRAAMVLQILGTN